MKNLERIIGIFVGLIFFGIGLIILCIFLSSFKINRNKELQQKQIYDKERAYASQLDTSSLSDRIELPKRLSVVSQELKIDTSHNSAYSYCLIIEDSKTKEQFIVVMHHHSVAIVPIRNLKNDSK